MARGFGTFKVLFPECLETYGRLKIYNSVILTPISSSFLRTLPTKLFNEVIMGAKTSNSTLASDSEAVGIISALFTSSDEVVSDLLDDAGVIPVPYPDEFENEAADQASMPSPTVLPSIENEDQSEVHTASEVRRARREDRVSSPNHSISSPGSQLLSSTPPSSYRTNYRASTPSNRQPSLSSFGSRPSTPQTNQNNEIEPFTVNGGQAEYCRLLNNVTSAAKGKRGGFPTRGAFNLDDLMQALPIESEVEPTSYDLPFGVRSENQLAHDMKIGAAGELYVRFNQEHYNYIC